MTKPLYRLPESKFQAPVDTQTLRAQIFRGMQSAPAALIAPHSLAASALVAKGPACNRVTPPLVVK